MKVKLPTYPSLAAVQGAFAPANWDLKHLTEYSHNGGMNGYNRFRGSEEEVIHKQKQAVFQKQQLVKNADKQGAHSAHQCWLNFAPKGHTV